MTNTSKTNSTNNQGQGEGQIQAQAAQKLPVTVHSHPLQVQLHGQNSDSAYTTPHKFNTTEEERNFMTSWFPEPESDDNYDARHQYISIVDGNSSNEVAVPCLHDVDAASGSAPCRHVMKDARVKHGSFLEEGNSPLGGCSSSSDGEDGEEPLNLGEIFLGKCAPHSASAKKNFYGGSHNNQAASGMMSDSGAAGNVSDASSCWSKKTPSSISAGRPISVYS